MLGIAGPSCAGKTKLAHAIADRLARVSILAMDRYYHDLGALCAEERARQNFDHPDALEWPRLIRDVDALAHGRDVMVPNYDFAHHEREPIEERFIPGDVVIVEGLYALYAPELRALYDLCIFIDHTADGCMTRRVRRDTESRGRTAESVGWQFQETVWPMYQQHIDATRAHADLVLRGTDAIDTMVGTIETALDLRAKSHG